MEISQSLKTEIYYALTDFLEAYKAEDTQVLAEKFVKKKQPSYRTH